tara:strand:+ start:514 stop:1071 length:558 start_codon:yes stop_codon:yes gene_type:complete
MEYMKKKWKFMKKESSIVLGDIDSFTYRDLVSLDETKWKDDVEKTFGITDDEAQKGGWAATSDNDKWFTYGLIYNKKEITKNLEKCPNTKKILRKLNTEYEILVAGFSLLKSKGYIEPHTDIRTDNSKPWHLGLITPECCFLYVDGNIIQEEDGKLFTFDDNLIHAAVNNSDNNRIILYLLLRER